MQDEKNCWYDSGALTPLPVQLENGTRNNFNPIPFLKNKNIISLYLFKRVADNMSGLPLSKQVVRMIQALTSMIALITVSWMLKNIMWNYCHTYHWKHLWKITYPCVTWSTKSIHIRILDIKVNQFRGNNPEHDITKHLFTPDFRWCKRKKTKEEETIPLGLPTTL